MNRNPRDPVTAFQTETEHQASQHAQRLAKDLIERIPWESTKQGPQYWAKVYKNLLDIAQSGLGGDPPEYPGTALFRAALEHVDKKRAH